MAKNNLYTLSYFRKRIKDAGFESKILIDKFQENDIRYWMITVHPKYNFICTCIKKPETVYFEFSDNKNNLNYDSYINTKSMTVIVEYLKNMVKKIEEKEEVK